jgi:hypothetical protein
MGGAVHVQLRRLLSTCLHLSRGACLAIREVETLRREQGGAALGAVLKEAGDPRSALTLADTRAQDLVWRGLRCLGNLDHRRTM